MANSLRFLLSAGAIGGIVAAILIVVLIIVGVSWWIGVANAFRTQGVKIDESASDIDVALTKRYDLLTKQLGIVKGYAKHESETLIKVVQARSGLTDHTDPEELTEYNKKLNDLAAKINVIVERYPDLKANTNFLSLQATAADTEEHLQASRRLFNSNVSRYNQDLVTFPRSMVAKRMKLTPRKFFQAENGKREDVKMEF